MAIKRLNTLQKDSDIIDLTSATTDYPLAVGETAIITYTSATSVPLRVATTNGEYELHLTGDLTIASTNSGAITFNPNNSSQTGMIGTATQVGITTLTSNSFATSTSTITMGSSLLVYANFNVTTSTKYKGWLGNSVYKFSNTNGLYRDVYAGYWDNTTTEWTSLGTITFPFAQSGKIAIKRIA